MNIIAVRHGELADDGLQLSETGMEQAEVIGRQLAGMTIDSAFAGIYPAYGQTADRILKYHPGVQLGKAVVLQEADMLRPFQEDIPSPGIYDDELHYASDNHLRWAEKQKMNSLKFHLGSWVYRFAIDYDVTDLSGAGFSDKPPVQKVNPVKSVEGYKNVLLVTTGEHVAALRDLSDNKGSGLSVGTDANAGYRVRLDDATAYTVARSAGLSPMLLPESDILPYDPEA